MKLAQTHPSPCPSPRERGEGTQVFRFVSLLRWLLFALTALVLPASAADGVPKPEIVIANPGKCIAPEDEMRRNHMEMLKHQRDKTLRLGQRGAKVTLNGCIECHASKKTGSVLGSDENFCQGCHAYAAVSLDCFECHQPKAGMAKVGAKLP
jgi:hypothetical protein